MSKPNRWTDYEDRLCRVTAYIHDHLDDPLDLNRLAEVACLSPYHWHRIYHAIHGETAAATVKRLRLHRAAAELAHGDLPIARVAERAGYPSVASFTRVFGSAFGLPHQGSYMKIGKALETLFGWFAARGLLKPETRSVGIYTTIPTRWRRSSFVRPQALWSTKRPRWKRR